MEPKTSDLVSIQIEKGKEKLDAAKVLLSEGITVDSHSALKTMFGLHFIKTGKIDKKYGRWLNRLKDERENGDYDIFTSFEREDAENSITEAEEFIQEMKRYLIEKYGLTFP